jgi:hypothetical protein
MMPELAFTYDAETRPASAMCTACGEQMPQPSSDLHDVVATIMWLSRDFIEHKRIKHATPSHSPDEDTNPQ